MAHGPCSRFREPCTNLKGVVMIDPEPTFQYIKLFLLRSKSLEEVAACSKRGKPWGESVTKVFEILGPHILPFCVPTFNMVEKWPLTQTRLQPHGCRHVVMEASGHDNMFIGYLSTVDTSTYTPTSLTELSPRNANSIFGINLEGGRYADIDLDTETIVYAAKPEVWLQLPVASFLTKFKTFREKKITFHVCGFYYLDALVRKYASDERFHALFPYAVASFLSHGLNEGLNIRTLPTPVCEKIKTAFSPAQFRRFAGVYRKSEDQAALFI